MPRRSSWRARRSLATTARAQTPRASGGDFVVPAWAFPVLGKATAPAGHRHRYERHGDGADEPRALHGGADTQPVRRGRLESGDAPCGAADRDARPEARRDGLRILSSRRRTRAAGERDGRRLPVDYFVQQVKDMRTRARHTASPVPFPSSAAMEAIADSVTDAELEEAARYFAKVRARRASRVVESDSVPSFMPLNGLSTILPGNGREALGERLVEVTVDLRRHELHDPMAEYVAYVPRGSLARGRALAAGGRTTRCEGCTGCHGADLRGVQLVPPIAGRSPSYLLRQLIGFRTGARNGATSAPMHEVATTLSIQDMVAAAAYAGSRAP
jgi:cytochrome c553